LVRLGLAGVAFYAAVPKLVDLRASQQTVALYQIFPLAFSQVIGVALPIVELALAVLFLSGLLSRYAALLFGLMLLAFMAGIASLWARGINISCGCFGPAAELTGDEQAKYGTEILRDVGFFAMTAFLALWPRSRFSLDAALGLEPVPKDKKTKD
jgi:uncharacterized membrane protein YphA (DoxX/SURF4 family)